MNKVICDICGTDYPETATQCPICGCAKADSGQTAAGNAAGEENSGYTYVRGGRFSKANVRKRLKASQLQQTAAMQSAQLDVQEDSGEDDFDEEELDNVSNKGLIVIVILLLLAIIAVGSYIAITFLGDRADKNDSQTGQSQQTNLPEESSTSPTQPQDTAIPCTKLTLHDVEIVIENSEAPWFELYWQVEPGDTTDVPEFSSSNPSVATVDENGVVTAVANGEAVITLKCGNFEAQCAVVCDLDNADVTEPTDEPDATEPDDEPDVPDEPVTLKLSKDDFTLASKGSSWKIVVKTEGIQNSDVTWTSDNEAVATVEDGLVVAVGVGKAIITATYDGQEAICIVRCTWQEATEPEDTTDTPAQDDTQTDTPVQDDTQTDAPGEDAAPAHELLIDGKPPRYTTGDHSAEFTLYISGYNSSTVSVSDVESVQWSVDNPAACSVDAAGKVTAVAEGTANLTAEVEGVVYTVKVIVKP